MRVADGVTLAEAVGERQDQDDEGVLVIGLSAQNIQADTFGLGWLIEQAVTHGFLNGRGDGVFGQRFQLEHTF